MPEDIESLRSAQLEVVDLATDQLEPDPANPNSVAPALMDALRRDILERGFVQPVIVRPHKGRYRIVDGEHRWRVLGEAGAKTVPCVIDDAGDEEGHMRMLTMNALRGQPHPVRQAKVLARLADQLGDAELRERLGMDEEEFDAALALKDVPDDLDDQLAAALDEEELAAPEVLRWRMGPRQARTVERALDELTGDGETSRAEALLRILSA